MVHALCSRSFAEALGQCVRSDRVYVPCWPASRTSTVVPPQSENRRRLHDLLTLRTMLIQQRRDRQRRLAARWGPAGLEPFDRDSGQPHGGRRSRRGRARPAMSCTWPAPPRFAGTRTRRPCHDRLTTRRKLHKVALVDVMPQAGRRPHTLLCRLSVGPLDGCGHMSALLHSFRSRSRSLFETGSGFRP